MRNAAGPLRFDHFLRGKGLLKPRQVALILMVAGAAAFIISLLAFGEQVLCLMGSTLVVFAGLMVNILARRYSGTSDPVDGTALLQHQTLAQAPAPTAWKEPDGSSKPSISYLTEPGDPPWRETVPIPAVLTQRTIEVFHQQGGDVRITNQRKDRSILFVISPSSKGFSVLVNEGDEIIDVSDVRGLYSLMVSTGAAEAIFVSASSFTPQAQEWAQRRAIQLVEADQVDTIEI